MIFRVTWLMASGFCAGIEGFAAVIVSTLAVAIAATVTVFSIVDAWLLRPLNFPDADRLVIAFAAAPDKPSEPAVWLPYRAYLGWKEQSRSFASISAAFFRGVTISTPDDARSSVGLDVSPDFFQTFGVAPLLGRTLTESDLERPASRCPEPWPVASAVRRLAWRDRHVDQAQRRASPGRRRHASRFRRPHPRSSGGARVLDATQEQDGRVYRGRHGTGGDRCAPA